MMNSTNIIQDNQYTSQQELMKKIEELTTPLTYYGIGHDITIDYISDIHLQHHLKFYNNDAKQMLRQVTEALAESITFNSIRIINGDLATDHNMVIEFFKYLRICCSKSSFTHFKHKLINCREQFNSGILEKQLQHQRKYKEFLLQKIEMKKSITNFNLQKLVNYRNRYRYGEDLMSAFEYFRKLKSFQKLNLTDREIENIIEFIELNQKLNECGEEIAYIGQRIEWLNKDKAALEKECNKPLEEITLNDFKLNKLRDIYFILGNHEYYDFDSIASAVDFYKTSLAKYGIRVLQNEMLELKCFSYLDGTPKWINFILYGGTGFAKYDEHFNANNTLCYNGFTREEEIEEGTKFEDGYHKALAQAKQEGKCFICASHYPTLSCLNHFNQETIYFTGHNHRNYYEKKKDRVVYADNQIGYYNQEITFKRATTGISRNPYESLEDGIHETTVETYLQFYRYAGEFIKSGKYLSNLISKGSRKFYVIKQDDYYGFFLVCASGPSKGISIANGGKTKKLTKDTDIDWIVKNFSLVISKYLRLLAPLRNVQTHLSKELRQLGLSGNIHGCIVDIDYYHHIMVNPTDGSIQFYYSPVFGIVKYLRSFNKVIESLHENSEFTLTKCEQLQLQFTELSKKKRKNKELYYLKKITNKEFCNQALLTTKPSDESGHNNFSPGESKKELTSVDGELQYVSRTEGAYGVSKRIQPLQRLFSSHILRDFDLRLVEEELHSYRKELFTGRILFYKEIFYLITEDNGSEIITAEEMELPKEIKDKLDLLELLYYYSDVEDDIDGEEEDDDDEEYIELNRSHLIPTGRYRKFIVKELKSLISRSTKYADYDAIWLKKL